MFLLTLGHWGDPRSGLTPKWGFGLAMLPVGALSSRILGTRRFQNRHFGRISSTLYFTLFQTLGGHASARRVSHEPCFRQAHKLPPSKTQTSPKTSLCRNLLLTQIPHASAPTFVGSETLGRGEGWPPVPKGTSQKACLEIPEFKSYPLTQKHYEDHSLRVKARDFSTSKGNNELNSEERGIHPTS